MSLQNDDDIGTTIGIIMVFIVGFVVAAFAALILTLVYLCALDRPIKIWKLVFEPYEARAFISGGFVGATLVPLFVAFCSLLFGWEFAWSYLPHMILGGYTLGSLSLAGTRWDRSVQPSLCFILRKRVKRPFLRRQSSVIRRARFSLLSPSPVGKMRKNFEKGAQEFRPKGCRDVSVFVDAEFQLPADAGLE